MSKRARTGLFVTAAMVILAIMALAVATPPAIAQQPSTVGESSLNITDYSAPTTTKNTGAELSRWESIHLKSPISADIAVPATIVNPRLELSMWEKLHLKSQNPTDSASQATGVNTGAELSRWEKLYLNSAK